VVAIAAPPLIDHDIPDLVPPRPTVTDLFCGAGGSSPRLCLAGYHVRIELNHWQQAIDMHAANITGAEHQAVEQSAGSTPPLPVQPHIGVLPNAPLIAKPGAGPFFYRRMPHASIFPERRPDRNSDLARTQQATGRDHGLENAAVAARPRRALSRLGQSQAGDFSGDQT
jgi:hypothetical protein